MNSINMWIRHHLLCCAVLLVLLPGTAVAQKPLVESPGTIVKINPMSLFVKTCNLQIEQRLSTRFSAQLGIAFGGPTVNVYSPNLPKPIDYTLVGITPEFRYFLSFQRRQVPRGSYLGAYLRVQRVNKSYEVIAYDPDYFHEVPAEVDIRINSLGGGFVVGYQFFLKKRVAIDIFMGPRYSFAKTQYAIGCPSCDGDELTAQRPGMTFDGLDLRAGVGLGYGFW
jgi:hypothetical protein